ncbi:hypothetical protein BXO88_03250 [Oribacterium sp. C9]|uniref:CPBP family intramembrane glutamic endopeptidase n=1 Tax=Oribacterium sp. C9 TaxID=1943579 RepID=UPI00098EB3F3|nr:type II CAAX endopeptidase family protein [Oribacterium sp. C9]OON87697.1 hypothetical protein BXO88_03250 [Oribacterium sp. C9]
MTKSIKRIFAIIAIVTLLFEIVFQATANILISYGSDLYRNEFFSLTVSAFLSLLAGFLLMGFERHAEMKHMRFNLLTLLWLILIMNGIQYLVSIATQPILDIIYSQGFDMKTARENATGADIVGFFGIAYSVAGAPIVEETFFRGIIYGKLRRYGKIFAITITAFLFGLLHCNLIQFFTAVVIGILFGWIRENYGLRYSILVHSCNNTMAFVMSSLNPEDTLSYYVLILLFYGSILTTILSFILNFKKIETSFRAEPDLGRMYYLWFTTIPVIIVTVFMLIMTAFSIFT